MTFPSSKSIIYNNTTTTTTTTSLPSFGVEKEKTKNNFNLASIINSETINHPPQPTLPSPSSPTVPLNVHKNLPLRKQLTKDHHQQQQHQLQHTFQSTPTTTSSLTSSTTTSTASSSKVPLQWQPIETAHLPPPLPSSFSSSPKKDIVLKNHHHTLHNDIPTPPYSSSFNSMNYTNHNKPPPPSSSSSSSPSSSSSSSSPSNSLPAHALPLLSSSTTFKTVIKNDHLVLKPNPTQQSKHIQPTHTSLHSQPLQHHYNNSNIITSPIKSTFIPTVLNSSSEFISSNTNTNTNNNNNNNNNKSNTTTTATTTNMNNNFSSNYNNNNINIDVNINKKASQSKRKIDNDENKHIKKAKRGRPPLNASVSKSSTNETTKTVSNHILKSANTNTTKPSIPESSSTTTTSLSSSSPTLYCICRKPYDIPRFMIACDRCDQWFHGECISISEKEGEFVDLYFCDACSKITGKKTSWKAKCSNPTCEKASRISKNQGHLSKYCSDHCGMQVARARLAMAEKENDNNN
ncbi:unnamed protein product [Cunninghamella echinulata]